MISRKKMLTLAVSTSLAGVMLSTTTAVASDSFLDAAARALGVTADSANAPKAKEGKCGEGKCGGNK